MSDSISFTLANAEVTEDACTSLRFGLTPWVSFHTIYGLEVMVTHADENGEFRHSLTAIAAASVDAIICCHPALVKKRYPDLPVLGDWSVQTRIKTTSGCIVAWEWDPDYEPC